MRFPAGVLVALVLAGCAAPEEAYPSTRNSTFEPPPATPTPSTSTPPTPTPPTPRPTTREIALELVASGVDRPLHVTHAGDGSGRLFVVEKTGKIRVIEDSEIASEPFLDLGGRVRWGGEQGLLSLAFHPRFSENGFAFVTYTRRDNAVVLARYHQVGAHLDPASATEILVLPKKETIHNGGTLAFGPDGMLYVSVGDGGGVGDPDNDAQDPQSLFGKILRIDVDASEPYVIPEGNPFGNEAWDLGLRNPWKFSFDRDTGDLWIGDVGQREREEIDVHPAGVAAPLNFGWPAFEGTKRYREEVGVDGATRPAFEYGHEFGCAVAGGFVYRGDAIPALRGAFLYSDLCSGAIHALDRGGERWTSSVLLETELAIVSFGEDEAGELYVVDHVPDGSVWRIVHASDAK